MTHTNPGGLSDRELLEAAARAAGAKPYDWETSCDGLFIRGGVPVILHNGDHDADWNPLTDDGDALRLAVKLQLTTAFEKFDGVDYACAYPRRSHQGCDEPVDDDPGACMRRAITRCAAALAPEAGREGV